MKVIVTCGGTIEPIDEVRAIANFSTGRFGHALSKELAKLYDDVEQWCPRSTFERLGQCRNVTYHHFRTAKDLEQLFYSETTPPRMVLQAAAVADYSPVFQDGKISSDQDELTIVLKRNEKILPRLRPLFKSRTFLVGFKLLANVDEKQLIEAAQTQLKAGRLNMVIANDLHNIKNNQHPVLVITAEGGVVPFTGNREDVAKDLAAFIYKRENVHWFESIHADIGENSIAKNRFVQTLNLAKKMNLLVDASGNISTRHENNLCVTPRGVDKSALDNDSAIPAYVNIVNHKVFYNSVRKPSIDTAMEAVLYNHFPAITNIIHFHYGWGRAIFNTTFPYPCGVLEEAEDIICEAHKNNIDADTTVFSSELIHHGFILAFNDEHLQQLENEWVASLQEFDQHLKDIKVKNNLATHRFQPIWSGVNIAGIIYNDVEGSIVHLNKAHRGDGIGRVVLNQLKQRGQKIKTVDECEVRDFYKRAGFTETSVNNEYVLTPPTTPLPKLF